MDQDRRIRERSAKRTTPPEIQEIRKKGHAKALALMEQFAESNVHGNNSVLVADPAGDTGSIVDEACPDLKPDSAPPPA
jgi:hypothetical protein